jgi:hypothetical protein
MIYHQIRFTLKPDAPKEQVDTAFELLHRVGREVAAVESFCIGRDLGGDFEYGALYVLKDIEAYKAYMHAPLHRQTDEAGLPVVDKMISMDLTDDEDPEIGAKIAEVHSKRFAGDPGLVELVEGLGSYQGSGTSGLG